MNYPYKRQLANNLLAHYKDDALDIHLLFENNRDEILLVLCNPEKVTLAHQELYKTLVKLPDIALPNERTRISFCDPSGKYYLSRIINPNTQDQINLALIGYVPNPKIDLDILAEI